jgi:hypothetical protein
MHVIQHCFIFRSSDSTVSDDAGIEPRTVASLALTTRRSDHFARGDPIHTWLDLIHKLARSHPQARRSNHFASSHPYFARSHPQLG